MTLETHRIPVANGESVAVDWTPPSQPSSGNSSNGEAKRSAVFVHGLGSHRNGDKSAHFRERFAAQGWGYLSVDLRGHGDSDGSMVELTLTRCLEDLSATLGWLAGRTAAGSAASPTDGARPPVLIGSSMGAAVIAWHHIAHPRPAGPMVMIAPALAFPGRLVWQLGPAEMEAWRATGLRRFGSEWIDLEIGFGLAQDALNYDPQKLLAGYAAPTLIVMGMKDEAVDWRSNLTFVEDCRYPHLELLLLKGGDHRLTERKGYLFDALWAWLADQS